MIVFGDSYDLSIIIEINYMKYVSPLKTVQKGHFRWKQSDMNDGFTLWAKW